MIKQAAISNAMLRYFKGYGGLICGIFIAFAISHILYLSPLLPVFLLLLVVYFRITRRGARVKTYTLLNLTFIFVIIFCASYLILKQGLHLFYTPYFLAPMLCAVLFSEIEISFLMALVSSSGIAFLGGNSLAFSILFLTSNILSVILVFGARKRASIIRSGFIVGITAAVLFFFAGYMEPKYPWQYLVIVVNGALSGILVAGILPVFEYLFKTITNISLLELADFNHPLLHRMMLEAPGTYHHSLVVGNLSEAACGAVGANALLARIGAYYHDIGKLGKPEYFSENESIAESKHDALSPTMSRLVIMNHVKEGVELAKKYRLSPRLIDFIEQHHGTSLVYYFYRRALETLEEEQGIKEEGFRYVGPRPDSKEVAIVLLADSVEAAARALKNPAPQNVEELVHKIINNKFIDGQLDECELTLKDLEKISALFIHILSGIYHTRVTYPDQKIASRQP